MRAFKTLVKRLLTDDSRRKFQRARVKAISKQEPAPVAPAKGSMKEEFINELVSNRHNLRYFVVFVKIGDYQEMIIFDKKDKETKADYYLHAYGDDMKLKNNSDVRIAKWGWTAGTTKISTGFYKMESMALKLEKEVG